MRRVALLATIASVVLAAASGPAAVAAELPQLQDGHGLHVDAVQQPDDRQINARVSTDALQQPVDIRILLPDTYDDQPKRRFPVLYLFHGTSGRASDWVNSGDAEQTTAGQPLIVVMPDAGFNGDGGGWFTNWFNGGAGGQPMWETFHVDQMIPWVDDNLRTIANRDGRAIAGLSQGGFGSLSYAARHPDTFTSTAAFSGGCEIDRDPEAISVATAIIQYTASVLDGADPDAMFGPRATQELNWQAHDPATLVTNLSGMQIALWSGNGDPGPLDPPGTGTSAIEVITYGATELFHGHLNEAGIPSTYTFYGAGTHSFPYWARDLRELMPSLMQRFARPGRRSRTVGYLSADDQWQQWGWSVTLDRPEPAFSSLSNARKRSFVLTGTGRAQVRTPAVYPPGARLRVVMRADSGKSTVEKRADRKGSLRLTVPLSDDDTPGTTRVTIRVLG